MSAITLPVYVTHENAYAHKLSILFRLKSISFKLDAPSIFIISVTFCSDKFNFVICFDWLLSIEIVRSWFVSYWWLQLGCSQEPVVPSHRSTMIGEKIPRIVVEFHCTLYWIALAPEKNRPQHTKNAEIAVAIIFLFMKIFHN